MKKGFTAIGDILQDKEPSKKPPAHEWQDLALRIIDELHIPGFKRNSVFKICKDYPKEKILAAMVDTKELCQTGQKWQYFFKIISES